MSKKKKVVRRRTKKDSITIPVLEEINLGKSTKIYKGDDSSYWVRRNSLVGKKAKDCEALITITNNSLIGDIFIGNDTANVHCSVTLKQLKSLLRKAEKMDAYWKKFNKTRKRGQSKIYSSFVHLSPDLSFHVDYGKKRKK